MASVFPDQTATRRRRRGHGDAGLRRNRAAGLGLALLVAKLIVVPAMAQPGWEMVAVGTTEDLLAFSPRVSQTRLIVGTNGFVARTSLQTGPWRTSDPGTTEDLLAVVGKGTREFWMSGRNGVMRYSTDLGQTWQEKDLPDSGQDYVLVRDNVAVFALGDAGSIYTSSTATGTWQDRPSGTTSALRGAATRVNVYDGSLAIGDDGTLLSADWGGSAWTPQATGVTADLYGIMRMDSIQWLIVGAGGLILKSTDDGETWTPRESGTTATLYALAKSPSNPRILAVGEDGTALETTDLGESWVHHDTGTDAALYTAVAASGDWLVAGAGGVMLRSSDRSVAREPGSPELSHVLSAVWPNPMTDRAALTLSVDRPQHVTARLYDSLGRQLAVIFGGAMSTGPAQTLVVDRAGLAAGLYAVRVQGETFAASRFVAVVR